MASFFDDITNADDSKLEGVAPPNAKIVDWFHGNASTREALDIHHRIGTGESDASPGNHKHNGKDSFPLFDDANVPADISNTATGTQIATAVNGILALLRGISD